MERNGNISQKGEQGVTVVIEGKPAQVSELTLNISNQFSFCRGWAAELSGSCMSRELELQEQAYW